jgi:hypothetical protein
MLFSLLLCFFHKDSSAQPPDLGLEFFLCVPTVCSPCLAGPCWDHPCWLCESFTCLGTPHGEASSFLLTTSCPASSAMLDSHALQMLNKYLSNEWMSELLHPCFHSHWCHRLVDPFSPICRLATFLVKHTQSFPATSTNSPPTISLPLLWNPKCSHSGVGFNSRDFRVKLWVPIWDLPNITWYLKQMT